MQTKVLRQIGCAGVTIVQTHHAFDDDEVSDFCRLVQALGAVQLTRHPQIKLIDRRTAGQL